MPVDDTLQIGSRVRFVTGDSGEPFGPEWDIEAGARGAVTAIEGLHDVHVRLDDGREYVTEIWEITRDDEPAA